MRAHFLVLAAVGLTALHAGQSSGSYSASCGLGVRWDVSESGYAGTWIRRGNTNTFDATWKKGSVSGTSTLTMSLSGNRVTIQRQDAANFGGGRKYVYDGTIGADGSFSGINSGTYRISGTVRCGDVATPAPSPSPASAGQSSGSYSTSCGLGVRWDVSESGYAGTWIRRGNTSTFDATWQKGSESGTSTLTMSLSGNRVTIQRQDAANFGGGRKYVYDGVIEADGSFSGINSGTYRISGMVRCGEVATPAPSAPPVSTGQSSGSYSTSCGLGVRWDVSESGYAGTWIRRGNTNTFDATWKKGSVSGTSILTMSLSGNRVTIQRQDAANFGGGRRYVYDGTIGADGSFSGINSGTYRISGTVRCGDVATRAPSPVPASADPGRTLVVIHQACGSLSGREHDPGSATP